ncbi:uncharacterized protein BJ212DRAFT_1299703 [Suillus subaureus]|uniref:Uncharacterized protein n=1 Tax=Suillus subaureus TaxID=48587 RepID=A0A9P7JDR0_9AGAM|nr:uncharacterized protein BJ212DRAFT_1299703 [Suillus subaureus]KAG1816431.1 hypothetical protein BJ212DRAFT_1299703 [Suillus subaureus]
MRSSSTPFSFERRHCSLSQGTSSSLSSLSQSLQAGLTMLRSQILLSAYLWTGLLHNAAYEQGPDLEVPIYVAEGWVTMAIITTSTAVHAVPSSPESGLVGPGSILSSSILESSYMGTSAYWVYGGDTSTDASNPTRKTTSIKKPKKVMLQYIASMYPKWARALGTLQCMTQVAVCCGETSSLFLLVMAEYASEQKALIESIWPKTLVCCNLQPTDLEMILTIPDENIMSEAEILALGDPWFSLWMYENTHHADDLMMTNCAGFDLKHIFGVALHHKVISITLKLMCPQSNCLPLADNGLVWFLNHQITKEMVYHVIFRINYIPSCHVSLADLDPMSFRHATHLPMEALSLVVTSCYEILLDYIDSEAKDSHGLISSNEMLMQICKTLPVLFNQSDDLDHVLFIITMKVLCDIKRGDVLGKVHQAQGKKTKSARMPPILCGIVISIHFRGFENLLHLEGFFNFTDALNLDVLGIAHNESNLVCWLQMKGHESPSLMTSHSAPRLTLFTASVLFGLVDPLDIKALIEVSLKENAMQTGLQQEDESCLEYLNNAIANLCEELNGRCHPMPSGVNPEKLVTPNAVQYAGPCQASASVNFDYFQPMKAIQEKCHAWLHMSSQSQDTTQDSNASRILLDFPVTLQYPCPHDHVLWAQNSDAVQPDDQLIPLPHVMKAWVNNFTYRAFMSALLVEANGPLHFNHGHSFTTKELKSLEVLKSDFHILDLKKQCTQSEVNMLSEAIARITEFHGNDNGWASESDDTDDSDFHHVGFDDWMSTSSMSSGSSL